MNRYIFQSRRQNIAVEEHLLGKSFTLSIQTNVLCILHTVVAANFLQILRVVQKFNMQFSPKTKSRDQGSQGHPSTLLGAPYCRGKIEVVNNGTGLPT